MTRPMILVSNDDGYGTDGMMSLITHLETIGDVWVVAPATEQSAVSSALSLHHPVRIKQIKPQHYTVSGTPADCTYMALNFILPRQPDICVSGVNRGANLGDDVIYSGTVAAAVEATLCEIPSLAVSLAAYGKNLSYDVAGQVATRVASQLLTRRLPRGVLLNINVPKDATAETEVKVCKLGRRNYERKVTEQHDPRGGRYYWIGGSMMDADDVPGSDCNAIAQGFISLTPINLDMTHYRFLKELEQWT